MQCRKLILALLLLLCVNARVLAQHSIGYEEADSTSYALYQKGQWQQLLDFGNIYLKHAPDFMLLRLRLGYAAFMLQQYSEALVQYDAALQHDSYNETAHYYSWLCMRYLNQAALADVHLRYLSKETIGAAAKQSFAITAIGTEVSYKATDILPRKDGLYARFDVQMRLHPSINMQHSFGLYNQTISEPKLPAVLNNNNIAINQKEYYNKTIINLTNHWQLLVVYHYAYTPFNNFKYNNHLGLVGLKYQQPYYSIQADGMMGRVTDTSLQQYNLTIGYYPLGNLNLYGFSTGSFSSRNNRNAFNFRQVLGAKLLSFLWLEGNVTLGKFSNYAERDAQYLYNAIDPNKWKAGATIYITLTPKLTAQAGYTFEQRELFQSNIIFNQYSITGGLSCQF